MNYKFKSLLLLIITCLTSVAALAQTTLFTGETEEIPYRIPAIVQTSNEDILVFADKRYGGGDVGQNGTSSSRIDIMYRRSSDNGANWTEESAIVNGSNNYGYGDVAVVADRENPAEIVFFCAAGNVFFTKGQLKCHRFRSSDGGVNWTNSEVTTDIYKALGNAYTSAFFSSGRICQSSKIKVGTHYRLYAALCVTGTNSIVLYSDDFGGTWAQLGSVAVSGGDEAKCVELPNGNVLVSSKGKSKRYFNVFKYKDNILPTTKNTADGSWTGSVEGCTSSDANGTNGELLLVPACKNGQNCYLVMQTIPASSTKASNRQKVTLYWKELNTGDLNDATQFAGEWTNTYPLSTTTSSYSTMIQLADGSIAFAYEENYESYAPLLNFSGKCYDSYDIQYRNQSISDIASGYTLPVLDAPVISLASGEVEAGTTVEISAATGATIYYTTNGDTPSTSSIVYSGPITINSGMTIKAIAVKRAWTNSPVASATYTINEETTTPDPVAPTFTLSTTTAELTVGGTLQLQYTSDSKGAVTYASSNTAVATVDANSGKVTAVGKGTATITATQVADGSYTAATATCAIAVNPANPTFTLSTTTAELIVGETLQLSLTNTSDGTVTYTSGNTAVATVNANGMVTAVAEGTATIKASVTATNKYNAAEATCTITVKAAAVEPDPEEPETPDTPELTAITVTAKSGKIGNSTYYVATFSHEKPMTVPNGVKAYYVKAAGGDEVTLSRVPSGKAIPAGQGVILISTSTGTFVMTESDGTNVADLTDNMLVATLGNNTVPAGAYVMAVKGSGDYKGQFAFCLLNAATTFENYANRAYLNLSNAEANIRMRFDDDATGIGSIENGTDKAPVYYDLMGRRVDNPTKGIYIVNGKKVLVR